MHIIKSKNTLFLLAKGVFILTIIIFSSIFRLMKFLDLTGEIISFERSVSLDLVIKNNYNIKWQVIYNEHLF